jgi:small subunit ribosomal protein S16
MGKIRNPQYRIVISDARTKRDGRAIEFVGLYHPKEEPSRIEVKSDRIQYWLSVGAQPSEPVRAILSKTGDWQKYKGLPAPTEPLRVKPERVDRRAIYDAESKAAAGLAEAAAPTKPAKKAAEPKKKAEAVKADAAPVDATAAPESAATEVAAPEVAATEAPAPKAEEQAGASAGTES